MLAFLIVFLVGVVLVCVTFVLGELFDIGGDVFHGIGEISHEFSHEVAHDVGAEAHGGADLASGADVRMPSPLSSRVIFIGLTAFGGFGFVGSALGWPIVLTLLFALFGFFAGGAGMFLAIMMPLAHQQGSIRELRSDYVGQEAQVTTGIPENSLGQVSFRSATSGALVAQPAVSENGEAIPRGTRVKIVQVSASSVTVSPCGPDGN